VTFTDNISEATRSFFLRSRVLGVTCLAHILHDGYSSMLYLLIPVWQQELSLSLTEIGVLKTLYSGAMALGQVPAGMLGERRGERMPLFFGTLLTAAAVLALGATTTLHGLGFLLVVAGLGASVQHPLASTMISRAYNGPGLRTTLGTYNFAGDLGKMAVPALLTMLIAAFNWRAGTEILGMLGLAVAAMLFLATGYAAALHQSENRKTASVIPQLPETVRRRGFAVLSVIGMLDSATRGGLLTFLPLMLLAKGADAAVIGTALSLVFAGGAAGKFACGALATRIGIVSTVVVTEVATAAAIVLLLTMPLSWCLLLMPVLGVALNGTSSVLYGTVPELAPGGKEGRAFGLFYTLSIGASAVAPTIYGAIGDWLNLTGSMFVVAVMVLFVVPLVFVLRPALRYAAA
jgi:MFS family permease